MFDDVERWTVKDYLAAVHLGDPSAPQRFWNCARLLALAKARRKGLSREDAEDAAMAAYCAASERDHAALARVRHVSTPLSSWIAGVLEHGLSKERRRMGRAQVPPPPELKAHLAAQRARLAKERSTRLGSEGLSRLGELTPKQRHALALYLEGLPMARIAERLSISRDAARERILRAFAHLLSRSASSIRAPTAPLLGPGGPPMDPAERATIASVASGRTYRQVASDRGESPEAVRSRVKRVRRRARKHP